MITEADWSTLRTGGMPAYERILRLIHAEQIELNARISSLEDAFERSAEDIERGDEMLRELRALRRLDR